MEVSKLSQDTSIRLTEDEQSKKMRKKKRASDNSTGIAEQRGQKDRERHQNEAKMKRERESKAHERMERTLTL